MESVPPPTDADAAATSRCASCRSATAADQRYCLECGALVGDRRLDPIAMLTPAATDPQGEPPTGGAAAGAPRAVPLAAATAAIVVAGISGMLVTNGGSDTGARAAMVSAAPAQAPAPASEPAAAPEPAAADAPASDPTPLPADEPLPAEPLPAADPLPAASEEPPTEPAGDDASKDEDDGTADEEPTEEPTPRVWLLALEGPQAAEAVERVAKQGVRLSGMQRIAADAQANATALVGGTRPVAAGDPAAAGPSAAAAGTTGTAAADAAGGGSGTATGSGDTTAATGDDGAAGDDATSAAAPSLPAALLAAKRTWRAYVDVQPTSGSVLPSACSAPPAGDAAAALLSSRLPFAAIPEIGCETSVAGLEALGNDLSAGEGIPDLSYVAMGGCAAPERTAVALPDAVEDAVATITASTEYQQDGMLVVTTVSTADACTPPAAPPPADPAVVAPATDAPSAAAADGSALAAPTVVLRPAATAGKQVKATLDLLALSRSMADVLGVKPPGASGDDAVPAIALPGVATS